MIQKEQKPVAAQKGIEALIRAGYQEHEAEEVVLPELILMPPEGDGLAESEREEEAELEREYRKEAAT